MSVNNKTYQPVQSITVKAEEDLAAFRFVSHLGTLCSDNTRAVGVTEVDWVNGEYAQVVTLGVIPVETSAEVNAGEDVTASASGKARKAVEGEIVNGRALDNSDLFGFVKIKLVP